MVTVQEKNLLQSYWNRENHIAASMPDYCEIATRNLFTQLLPDVNKKKVLDIGCGHGNTLQYFKDRGAYPFGIDLSSESVRVARSKGFSIEEGDCCILPYPDQSFDIVFSIGVIEHFSQTKKAAQEHIRVLKPGGMAIIIVPHLLSISCYGAVAWHFLRGNFLHHSLKTTIGKAYTKGYFKRLIDDGCAKKLSVFGYYGSAFLKPLTMSRWDTIALFIDRSWYSKAFGHMIALVYEK